MSGKFCKDCKWHQYNPAIPQLACEEDHLCLRPELQDCDMVTGEKKKIVAYMSRSLGYYCGPGAHFFEQKETADGQ